MLKRGITKFDMKASRVSSSESELSSFFASAGPGDPGAGMYSISGSAAFLAALNYKTKLLNLNLNTEDI